MIPHGPGSFIPWVIHRGVADLGAKAAAVGLEGAAGELRAVVGDDVVGQIGRASCRERVYVLV